MDKELEWCQTKPQKRQGQQECKRIDASFLPRIQPYNFFVYMAPEIHEMEPIEYLICYSNELTAIGVAKDLDTIGNRPLTMQFGTMSECVGRDIYIGCIVLVKSYARMITGPNQELTTFANRNAIYRDIFFNARLYSNVLATEWIITHKPKVERTLGIVTEFKTINRRNGRVSYDGKVYDQENNVEIDVHNDLWRSYIKKEVPIESAVVLSWIKMEEPHAYCEHITTKKTLLPSGATRFDLKGSKEMEGDGYWLVCVDTNFKASRTF